MKLAHRTTVVITDKTRKRRKNFHEPSFVFFFSSMIPTMLKMVIIVHTIAVISVIVFMAFTFLPFEFIDKMWAKSI